jgi:hypothetical protein
MTFGEWIRNLRLPLSVISGPIIWAVELMVGYVLVPVACQKSSNWILLVLGIVTAVPTVVMGLIAYRGWKHYATDTRQPDVANLDAEEGLGEFLGSAGTLVSLLFFILIAATAIYGFCLSPCPVITMPFP